MNRGSPGANLDLEVDTTASMRPRFMNRGSGVTRSASILHPYELQ